MVSIVRNTVVGAALCVAVAGLPAFAEDKPEVIHQHPGHPIAADTTSSQDPYKDCVPNAEKAAQMKEHPMPETKGMRNMDPKLHEIDCPQGTTPKTDRHVHKPVGGN
jgi:hypothetical protein